MMDEAEACRLYFSFFLSLRFYIENHSVSLLFSLS